MKLKIADLYPYQLELDSRIFTLHNVTRIGTRQARILALQVELAEMANETRCFKYWSQQEAAEKAVILEEYGDGIHFLLSLGIDLQDQSLYIENAAVESEELTTVILKVFSRVNELQNNFSLENYYAAFRAYLDVGELLGFNAEEIEEYYLLKNQKNHERQDNNY